jgi:hypothetical protein
LLLLGWVGFGVPDWHAFQHYNGSTQEYYGLWAYCQTQYPLFTSVCKRWPDAEALLFNGSRPSFVRTADGLITTGMILLSFGLVTAIFSAVLPLLAYLAGILTFLGFLFLIIGLPIFGRQSNSLSALRNDATYNKRYGFWLIVPTIVLSFLAALLFLAAGFVYQRFGFGNIASHAYSRRPYGGQRLLGPANVLRGMPYAMRPGLYVPGGMMQNPYQVFAVPGPSLLSQYIAQRIPRYYGPIAVRRTVITSFPQPSIVRAMGQPAGYSAPAYYRFPVPQQSYAPINLSGQTLVGPVIRSG